MKSFCFGKFRLTLPNDMLLFDFKDIPINNKDIIISMLKLNEKDLITEKSDLSEIVVDKNISIFYDGSENQEKELLSLNKEKERLESSIERREKLLSNENYVSKAPQNLVEQERKTLQQEKENLDAILAKLNK